MPVTPNMLFLSGYIHPIYKVHPECPFKLKINQEWASEIRSLDLNSEPDNHRNYASGIDARIDETI